jgi:hypothetical protein
MQHSPVLAVDVPSLEVNTHHSGAFVVLSADFHSSMYRSMQPDFPIASRRILVVDVDKCLLDRTIGMKED